MLEPNEYHSQSNQDQFAYECFFRNKNEGFYVEVGASNGIQISNTLFFEKLGWHGICIEPIPSSYEQLVKNRKSINLNCAIDLEDGIANFVCNTGYTELLSGLESTYQPEHAQRLNRELQIYGGTSNVIQIPTRTLESIFVEHNVKHVDYLSVDVEGGEFNVIKSINFDRVKIDVISFENNYAKYTQEIINYLLEKGYTLTNFRDPDVFMYRSNMQRD